MKGKVLFIDSVHPVLREELESDGWKCDWHTTKTREEITKEIGNYEGIVIRSKFTMNRQMIDRSTKLKFIARSGAGLENIDVEYAKSKGIVVFNSPEGNRNAVGEQAIGMLLSLFQKLNKANKEVRSGIWDREGNRGVELKGKTVGIIGFGNMGKAFAQRLQGFECEGIAYDKYKEGFSSEWVEEVCEDEFFERSEIVSIHVPWTRENKHLVNSSWLSKFNKPIVFINSSRGAVVNTSDLLDAIDIGQVSSIGLDVLEFEGSSLECLDKLEDAEARSTLTRLLESPNAYLSPHVAGWTTESYIKLSSYLANKILKDFSAES